MGRPYLYAGYRLVDIGLADLEFLDLEATLLFDDPIEDLRHDPGIDQVSFGFNDLLEGSHVRLRH